MKKLYSDVHKQEGIAFSQIHFYPQSLFRLISSVVFMFCFFLSFSISAQTNGTADGTYDFGTLGADDSGGSGYKIAGDKFVVSNGFDVFGGALYLTNVASATVEFKAEGGSTMKQATLQNMVIGMAGGVITINQFDISLKDASGANIATHALSGDHEIDMVDGDVSISTLALSPAWPVAGYDNVAEISITYNLSFATPNFEFRSITLANISNTVVSNNAPTATAPNAPSITEDDTNVALANDIDVADSDGDDQTLIFTITGGTLTIGTSGVTFGGGGNGSASFTAAGTLAAINTALDAATYTPIPNLSGTNAATISFTSHDGTAVSSAASVSFDIAAVNDEPTLTATATNPTFTEDGSAAVVFSSASASTFESGQTLSALTLTVTNVNDGSNERLNIDGTAIVLTHGTSGTTASNSLSYSVSVSGTTATLSLSGGTLSTSALQTLINAISYQNNSNTPNTSNRVVTITHLTDSGSNTGSNDNVAALAVASTVKVNANNDAPVFTSIAGLVETTTQNTEVEITLADLEAYGNEHDVDGTVDAFIVKTLSNGTLNIGVNSGSATSFNATTNKTINAINKAYWTPATDVYGTQNAFTVIVLDNDGAESIGAVQALVAVNDVTKPEVSSISISGSPAATATSITFVVTFTESVVNVSTDDFILTKGSSATGSIASVSASTGTSMNVTVNGISGTGVLRLDLDASTNITDGSANSSPEAFNLGATHSVDLDNPTLSISVPTDEASGVSASANITLSFNENIAFSTGNIQIIDLDDGSNSFTIDAASPGVQASISGNVLTLNPSSDLEENTNYAVQIDATAIDDSNGNSYAGIVDNTTLNFLIADITAPLLVSNSPLDNATNVTLGENIILNFDDNMVAGTGNITIKKVSDNTVFEQIAIGDAKITISSNQVTINPTNTFARGIAYYLEIEATALDDDGSNSFAGISGNSTLNFTAVDVVINEVITDPQQDWSTNDFNGTVGVGAISSGTDEWIELLINSDGVDFTGWAIELLDGTDVSGDLTNTGAFDVSNYLGSGSFVNTVSGDYLVLGDVDGVDAMNNTGLTINLKDPSGALVDAVVIGGGAGEAPSGNADDNYDESVQRYTNGLDTDTHDHDFTLGMASMGSVNTGPSVTLSVSSATIAEASGVSTLTATLSAATSQNVTVTLAVDGTSTAVPADYTLSSSSIVITAGSITGAATLTATSDSKDENNETVIVNITGVTNGTENGTQQETVTINDDDDAPTIAFNVITSNGLESSSSADIRVDLSAASGRTVTVDYTVTGTASGSGTDYSLADGTLIISAGSVNKNITIASIVDDLLDETNETVILTLSSPTNASLGTNTVHTYTINDNDAPPTIAFNVITSNGSEALSSANIDVDLSAVSSRTVTVDYTVTGTASGSGTDYNLADGTLTIGSGNINKDITIVSIVNDLLDENNETVIVTLSNPSNASLGTNTVHTYTINDNDATPTIAFNATSSNGSEALGSADLQVDLSAASGRIVTVDYTVTGTASGSGTDYNLADGTLTINAGSVNKNITIASIVNDLLYERNETVIVTLSNATNASLGTNTVHTYSINNDDDMPRVSLSVSSSEIGEGEGIVKLIATVSEISSVETQVFLEPSSGTATFNFTNPELGDYTANSDHIYIAPGDLSNFLEVRIIQDNLVEENETIIADIRACDDGIVDGDQQQIVTIVDDDVAGFTLMEIDGGTTVSESGSADSFTLVLDAQPLSDVVLNVLSGDVGEVMVDQASITFTNTNWNEPQTINLTGVDDVNDDGNQNTFITLSVNATLSDDHFDLVSNKTLVVITEDDDDSPVVSSGQSYAVNEDSTNGTSVGTVLATDGNAGTTFGTWTITGGNSDAIFTINTNTGEIAIADNANLDFERSETYTLGISVSDGVNTSSVETVSVTVNDINDEIPVVTASQIFTIDENLHNGNIFGTVKATDLDSNLEDLIDWTITNGNDNNAFVINSLNGQITVNNSLALDREQIDKFLLEITVSDGELVSEIEIITIQLNDLNDNRPVVTMNQTFSVNENSVDGTIIGNLTVTDADVSETTYQNWTITNFVDFDGNGNNAIAIDPETGELTVNDPLDFDFETTQSFSLRIKVSDGTDFGFEEEVFININNLNDNTPVIMGNQTFSVNENAINTTSVGTILVTDSDAGTMLTDWTIISGNENAIFTINTNTGEIAIADNANLDFERSETYTLGISVSDGVSTSIVEDIVIQITDVNEAPTAIQLSNATIAEDLAIGTEVGILTASDEDVNQNFIYTIVDNENFELVGDRLLSKAVFNFVNLNSYTVDITVKDQGDLSFTQPFTIQILNTNEAPTAIHLSNFTIAENAAIGSELGVLTTTDPDINETFTYRLAENSYFEVDGDKIVSKEVFNFEDHVSYSIKVTVTDQGGLSFEERFTINIEDVNEAPEFISEPILEARVGEQYTYSIEVQDVDADKVVITALEIPSWLTLIDHEDGTGTLSGIPTEAGSFTITLSVSDQELSATQEFEFEVEIATGIEDVFTATAVKIYPNPVLSEVHIDLSDFSSDELTISLFSLTGSLIFKEEHQNIGGDVKIIKSVQQLKSGVYLLLIDSEDYHKSFKIVKQ